LRLFKSITRNRGGFTSTTKWKRDRYGSLTGSRALVLCDRPTTKLSRRSSRSINPAFGPSVTASNMSMGRAIVTHFGSAWLFFWEMRRMRRGRRFFPQVLLRGGRRVAISPISLNHGETAMLGRQLHALAASGLTLLPFAAQPAIAAPPAAQAPPAATAHTANRRVVAFIHGNVPIYRDELGDYLISRGGMDKIELLVNRRIIHEAMKQRNLTVSTNEIEGGLEFDLRGAKVELDAFIQYIRERYGKSLFEWKQDVILPRLQLGKMCHKDVVITPDELKLAFESRFGEKREAQLIVWPKAAAELPAAERGKARSSPMEFEKLAAVQPDQRLAQS